MDLELKDKVFVVSGGAKGIGEAIVKLLAEEGAIPIILGRNEKNNLKVISEIEAAGGKAFHVVTELADPESCVAAVNQILEKFDRVDGLVNNAGVNDGVGLENGDYERFMKSVHSNVVHYYLLAHHLLPQLKKTKGVILNVASKTAVTGQGNTSAYAASNGGRLALTREWAVELLKYEIRVNAVIVSESYTPAYEKWIKTLPDAEEKLKEIETKIPLGNRMTKPSEIANAVVFLLSSKSARTTGQLVYVDGGYVHLDRALANA